MANRIKGITIEIGGDTTKLDKALAGTNKQLSQTQSALKDVEKGLKMDPGNTELLAQKQRLLGDAVEGTKQKLDTLRKAAANADQALQRGQDYEAKYQPLKQKLDEVSASLRGLEANEQEMQKRLNDGEISMESYDAYLKKLDETKKTQGEVKQSIKDLNAAFSGAKIDRSQYDAIQRELIQTENDLKNVEGQAKRSGSAMAEFGDKLKNQLDSAEKVKDAFSPVSKAIAGIGAAALATVPATEEYRASMSMLENNARTAGVGIDATRQAFEQFAVVSNEVDSSVEATSNLLQSGFTESNLQKAVEGLAGAYLTFPDTMKIESLADSLQETLATGTATGQFGELLDRLGVGAENFSDQIAKIPDEADKINFTLSTLAQEGMMDVYDGWTQNNQALIENRQATQDFKDSIANLARSIQPFLTQVTEMASSMLDWFNGLPDGAKAAAVGIATFLAVISPIAGIIATITGALGTAATASVAFSIAGHTVSLTLGGWLIIIGLVTAAVLALAAAIAVLVGKSKEVPDIDGLESTSSGGRPRTPRSAPASLFSLPDTDTLPHLANGAVAKRNSPFLAVVGDNTQEDEVISPYSTIKRAAAEGYAEAAGRGGGGGNSRPINMILDGVVVARLLAPYLDANDVRRGVKVSTT